MDINNSNLVRIESLINGAAMDSRQWPKFLEEAKDLFDADAVMWAEFFPNGSAGRIRDATGINYEFIRSYDDHFVMQDPWLSACNWYCSGQAGVGEELIPSEKLTETAFFKNWLQPQGLFYRLCAVVKAEDGRVLYLAILRSREAGSFDGQHLETLKSLAPKLQQAVARNDQIWRLTVTLDVLDNFLPIAVSAVSKEGRLLFANTLAKELLSEEDGLQSKGGSFCMSRRDNARQFAEMIEHATSVATKAGASQDRGKAMLVQRKKNRLPLWVVVSPLSRRFRSEIGQEDQLALVFVVLPERLGKIPEITLKSLFGLTNAEQKLAKLIVQGGRLEQAADQLCISINTARTHMKRIYAKTETCSQTELVRLMLAGQFNHLCLTDGFKFKSA
jgi:DNA-binding CsgD family transcriptional regulator